MPTAKQLPGNLPPGMTIDSLLQLEQAAVWMGISARKLAVMIRARTIPALNLGHKSKRICPRAVIESRKK